MHDGAVQRNLRNSSDVIHSHNEEHQVPRDEMPHGKRSTGAEAAITRIVIAQRALRWRVGMTFEVAYDLTVQGCSMSATMIDPEIGELTNVSAPEGISVRTTRRDGQSEIEISRSDGMPLDGATVRMRILWDKRAIAQLKGSPICVLPTHLPQLKYSQGPYSSLSHTAESKEVSSEPRIRLNPLLATASGHVTDLAGELLMVAMDVRGTAASHVWYSDAALVLAGTGLGTVSADHRASFRDRVLDIHRFLDAEFGQGQHVRALLLCERGANRFLGGLGQIITLEDTWLDSTGDHRWFIAERIIVQQMASIWWHYGIRPSGINGESIGEGFAMYAVLRWFEVTGNQEELAFELTRWQEQVERIEQQGDSTRTPVWRSTRIALALHACNSLALRREMRAWCATEWGSAVPATVLAARLLEIGIDDALSD